MSIPQDNALSEGKILDSISLNSDEALIFVDGPPKKVGKCERIFTLMKVMKIRTAKKRQGEPSSVLSELTLEPVEGGMMIETLMLDSVSDLAQNRRYLGQSNH